MPWVSRRAPRVASGRSARRTERGIALVAAGVRALLVVQIGFGLFSGVGIARHPLPYIVVTAVVVLVSILLILWCLRTRTARRGWWQLPDLALGWLAFPASALVLPASVLEGTWAAWAPALAVNVAAVSGAWLRPWLAVTHGFALAAWGFWWTGLPTQDWAGRIGDALTVPGYAAVVALLVSYLRALARDADQSRADAVAATQALELQRYQLAVHDASSILRQLSDTRTPPEVLPGLRKQAHREANRLRRYLGDPTDDRRAGGSSFTVGSMLSAAMNGFDDLPLEPAVELGAHVVLSEQVWLASSRAVATVLHNVRLHADARQVVVHADSVQDTWEVVVSDDGVGFDQASQPLGFGLGMQVQQSLADVGVAVTLASAPGRGTSVTIVGETAAS